MLRVNCLFTGEPVGLFFGFQVRVGHKAIDIGSTGGGEASSMWTVLRLACDVRKLGG